MRRMGIMSAKEKTLRMAERMLKAMFSAMKRL